MAASTGRCGSPWSASAGGLSARPTHRRSLPARVALGCAPARACVAARFLSGRLTHAGRLQVRVKWWGEEGYGSLLRPAACAGLGPALTSSIFYSIRCSRYAHATCAVVVCACAVHRSKGGARKRGLTRPSCVRCRPRLLEYFKDAGTVRLDIVDERTHAIVAHGLVDLTARCTGMSVSEDGQDSSECLQDGPGKSEKSPPSCTPAASAALLTAPSTCTVAMYSKDGSKVGEVTVCLDFHYKRQAQRTSFELNELLSQTDPTLQLYPSDAGRSGEGDGLGISFLSASHDVSSVLQLSSESASAR